MPERSLVTIGDDCTLNAGSTIQCHSQEDGSFKSDRISLGSGCTVGVGAWVHYGVTMGERAVLAPDAFLMKGAEVLPGSAWSGNPAAEITPGSRARVPVAASGTDVAGRVDGRVRGRHRAPRRPVAARGR
jgi:acetyltransferase-like isoleucine patch superfamily enzyme